METNTNPYNPANVAITGGAITGTNVPYVPQGVGAISSIPFIYLSSGTVSAVGAISAITALPQVYPSAYCWFPANALATAIAAGWYYCTFSTTTAGTAFLNTYTTGQPTIPSSPTAVTDGKGAFVSDTTSHAGPTYAVAGNSLGINGQLHLESDWQFTNSAGNKTLGLAFGALTVTGNVLTTQASAQNIARVSNAGVANKQNTRGMLVLGNSSVSINTPGLGTVDTTASQNVVYTLTKAAAADNVILERYSGMVLFSN